MNDKPTAPATDRNRDAILEVLRQEFEQVSSVLEIGSGTGQHAIYFGDKMPWLEWQTSDRSENHPGINAWVAESSLHNVRSALDLDVEKVTQLAEVYDAVFSANTAHIMSFDAVICMFAIVGRTLREGGVFCLYGPFKLDGDFTSPSNQAFDRSLRSQDPKMGIRDFETLLELGMENGLRTVRRYALPANNMLLVWRKEQQTEDVLNGES